MKYDLKNIIIGFKDEDGKECEETFSNASSALSFVMDNIEDFDMTEEDFEIVANFKEKGVIHSASLEPLDEGEEELSFSQLRDLADEEPQSYVFNKEQKTKKSLEDWISGDEVEKKKTRKRTFK